MVTPDSLAAQQGLLIPLLVLIAPYVDDDDQNRVPGNGLISRTVPNFIFNYDRIFALDSCRWLAATTIMVNPKGLSSISAILFPFPLMAQMK